MYPVSLPLSPRLVLNQLPLSHFLPEQAGPGLSGLQELNSQNAVRAGWRFRHTNPGLGPVKVHIALRQGLMQSGVIFKLLGS